MRPPLDHRNRAGRRLGDPGHALRLRGVFDRKGPKAGEPCPDFIRYTVDGPVDATFHASAVWAEKPVVSFTGSYSCPAYRQQTKEREALVRDFGKRVAFVNF